MPARKKLAAVLTLQGEELEIEENPGGFADADEYFAFVDAMKLKRPRVFARLSVDAFIREKREESGRD